MFRDSAKEVLVDRRWGKSVVLKGREPGTLECWASGYLFRKHLYGRDAVCRRCGFRMAKEYTT